MSAPSSVHTFLGDARVAYTIVPHAAVFTAQEGAAVMHVPGRDWAKVVVCMIDGEPVQAVLPAPLVVHLDRLLAIAGGATIRFATEEELRALYPDCELGAMPPFGPIYGHRVIVDAALAAEPEIVFNAGTHREAIRMRYVDFARAAHPVVGRFAEQPVRREFQERHRPLHW